MQFRSNLFRGGLLAAAAIINIPSAKGTLIIDSFNDFQQVKVQPTPGVNTATSMVNGPGILGGNREFFLERDSSLGSANANNGTLISDASTLNLTTGSSQRTRATVTYDGTGIGDVSTNSFQGTPTTFFLDEAIGLALADFESSGYAFQLNISSDQSLPLTIKVWNGNGTNFVARTLTIPIGADSVIIPFSTFTGTTAPENVFSNVGALTVSLGTPGAAPFTSAKGAGAEISFLAVVPTPEPSTLALAGGALVGLVAFARKRRAH
jgi:hypothetical protein